MTIFISDGELIAVDRRPTVNDWTLCVGISPNYLISEFNNRFVNFLSSLGSSLPVFAYTHPVELSYDEHELKE